MAGTSSQTVSCALSVTVSRPRCQKRQHRVPIDKWGYGVLAFMSSSELIPVAARLFASLGRRGQLVCRQGLQAAGAVTGSREN